MNEHYMRSQGLLRPRIMVLTVLVLLFGLFAGCVALTQQQQETLDKLQADIVKAAGQVKRIYDLQADVRKKYKAGELDAGEAVGLLSRLQDEAKEATANWQALQESYEKIKKEGKGIPWYHWLWSVASTALAIYLGKEKVALGDGLNLLISSIEKGKDKTGIKERVAKANNNAINNLVRKLT